jgi:hypothetical protein
MNLHPVYAYLPRPISNLKPHVFFIILFGLIICFHQQQVYMRFLHSSEFNVLIMGFSHIIGPSNAPFWLKFATT